MAANMGLSEEEGAAFYDKLRERYPDLFKWLDEIAEFGQKYHWVQLTKDGLSRRRRFLGGNARGAADKASLGRLAKNTPIQGNSAIMTKMMLVDCDSYLQENGLENTVFILGQIHDEFIFSTPGRVYLACDIEKYHEAKEKSGDKEPKLSKYQVFSEEVWPVMMKSGEILDNPFAKMGELMSNAGTRCMEGKMVIGTGLAAGPYWVKD